MPSTDRSLHPDTDTLRHTILSRAARRGRSPQRAGSPSRASREKVDWMFDELIPGLSNPVTTGFTPMEFYFFFYFFFSLFGEVRGAGDMV